MLLWIFILETVTYSYGQIREAEYECGAHGRFEYCIDGIPGCVVGCHCHPGYYFDTDTKICEPNIRLTQNFRRNYELPEPTRVYLLPTPPVVEDPATTEQNAVDEKIDIITKDADDLGDWLYNQFFKTIENRVINETKNESIVTRRSESSPSFFKKPTRRSHKYWRAKRKKKKRRKGLKSKLLRITEDDSLFDSSSDSTSDESSDSSSSSSTTSEEKSKEKKKPSDHGHKKIVVFNKRPKPPLPSFIFLPNMETPFFPPIGLPPPPIPMYPMVPVPPVMGPYPFQAQQDTNQNGVGSTNSASASPTAEPVSTASSASANIPTTVPDTSSTAVTIPTDHENAQNAATIDDAQNNEATEIPPESKLRSRSKLNRGPRNKLMKKFREQLKRKNKLQNYFANEYQNPESPMDIDAPPECIANPAPKRPKAFPEIYTGDKMPGMQDVDFKYLSQLIHRANLNKTIQNPSTVPPPTEFIQNVVTLPPPSRRNYFESNPNEINKLHNNLSKQPVNQIPNQLAYNAPSQPTHMVPYRKKIEDTNDIYYANLGRQIASMIRNIEGDVDIEIEKSSSNVNNQPPFNGNSGSLSYWERSVRSPFKTVNALKKEMNDLKKSNENLFSLENKVEIAAATVPTLSLQELENIISKVERAKTKLIRKRERLNRVIESSKTSFNVNLLPDNIYSYHSNKNRLTDDSDKNTKKPKDGQTKKHSYNNNANLRRQNAQFTLQTEPRNSFIDSIFFSSQDSVENQNETVLVHNNVTYLLPTKGLQTGPQHKFPNAKFSSYAYTVLPLPPKPARRVVLTNMKLPPMKATTSKTFYHQLSPMARNYKKINYYNIYNKGNYNKYKMEKTSIPDQNPTFTSYVEPIGRRAKYEPSYFHHELNRFDYIDDFF